MSTKSDDKNSNQYIKNTMKTLLTSHIESNRDMPRRTTSFQVNPDVAQAFYVTCQRLGLATYRQGANKVIEAFMSVMNDLFKDEPQQTILVNYRPTINNNFNITERIEVKLVKDDLRGIIAGLQRKDAPREHIRSLNVRLKKTLPKAIKLQNRCHDPDLEKLLVTAEKNLR